MTVELISWNVNGLRACLTKGFSDFFAKAGADVCCLQETKMQRGQAELVLDGYKEYWNSAQRKGYSGTAVFAKEEPLAVWYDIGRKSEGLRRPPSAPEEADPEFYGEGRVITLEFEKFYLVNVYTPNAKEGLARIDYRMAWEDAFREHLLTLDRDKPVVACGDLNVAHEEIDLKNPKSNRQNAGFSDQERGKMTELLAAGFTDTFRFLHPEEAAYSWWSYRFNARKNNAGWRIDYFLVSDRLREAVEEAAILGDVPGSDHCPVRLRLAL